MLVAIAFAATSGLLVGINRQVNGRLALSTSPLMASFINHLVGFALLTVAAVVGLGQVFPAGAAATPWYAYLGGPMGLVFVAVSSWLIPRIGAVQMTLLLVSGQIVSGVVFDIVRGVPGSPLARVIGVGLILTGVVMTQRRRG